jgi:hypothetical protein
MPSPHAAATATAAIIAEASGLSHGYWTVLTVFIVPRPDYSSTLYRGLQRAAGTVLGAGLGVATVQLARLGLTALLIGIGVSLLAAYAVFAVNYLVYGVFLTDFVVVLLALLGLPAESTAVARLIGTDVGTGLAIGLPGVAHLGGNIVGREVCPALPRAGRVCEHPAACLHAARRCGGGRYPPGSGRSPPRPAQCRGSADRLAGEPDHPPMTAQTARALESAGHRVAQACLTLGAVLTAHRAVQPADDRLDQRFQPRLDRLANGISGAMSQIAGALRAAGQDGPQPPGGLPPLRELQQAIRPDTPDRESADSEVYGLLAATDSLVDAVNTAAHALGEGRTRGPVVT